MPIYYNQSRLSLSQVSRGPIRDLYPKFCLADYLIVAFAVFETN